MKAFITDYISNPDLEYQVLGDYLALDTSGEVAMVWHQQIGEEFLADHPNLRCVIRYGVGYDNIDLVALAERNIVFCNTPDYGVDEVSDTTVAMVMTLTRRIVQYDVECRSYTESWQENTIPEIRRTNAIKVGIVGFGRIGSLVGKKLKYLGFQIGFYDPYLPSGVEKVFGVERFNDLGSLLETSDVVSLHCPLTSETRCMVDQVFINHMKNQSYLVNTARGELIENIDHLDSALRSEKILGVALDVLSEEPPSSETSKLIASWRSREPDISHKIIINPHTAYFSQEAYKEMRSSAARNALRFIEGKPLLNRIC